MNAFSNSNLILNIHTKTKAFTVQETAAFPTFIWC